jgi:hypothetical protein
MLHIFAGESVNTHGAIVVVQNFMKECAVSVDYERLIWFCQEAETQEDRNRCLTFFGYAITSHPRFNSLAIVAQMMALLDRFSQAPVLLSMRSLFSLPDSNTWAESAVYHWIGRLNPLDQTDIDAIYQIFFRCLFESREHFVSNSIIFPFFVTFAIRYLSQADNQRWIENRFIPRIVELPDAAACLLDVPYWPHWFVSLWSAVYEPDDAATFMAMIDIPEIFNTADATRLLLDYLDLYRSQKRVSLRAVRQAVYIRALEALPVSCNRSQIVQRALQFLLLESTFRRGATAFIVPAFIAEAFDTLNASVSMVQIPRVVTIADAPFARIFAELLWKIDLTSNFKKDPKVLSAVIFMHALSYDQERFESFTERFLDSAEDLAPDVRSEIADCLMTALTRYEYDLPEIYAALGDHVTSNCSIYDIPVLLAKSSSAGAAFLQFQQAFVAHFEELYATLALATPAPVLPPQEESIVPLPAIRAGFFRDLGYGSGPWSVPRRDLRFKACNRISLRGRRVLSVINHRFETYEGAVRSVRTAPENHGIIYRLKSYNMAATRLRPFLSAMVRIGGFRPRLGELQILDRYIGFLSADATSRFFIPFRLIHFIFVSQPKGWKRASIEIFIKSNKSYSFAFENEVDQPQFLSKLKEREINLPEHVPSTKFHFFQALQDICGGVIQIFPVTNLLEKLDLTRRWQNWEIDTFDYLYYLNLLSGRSYSDLYNYPIFPWTINDCSAQIDIENPAIYRDLSCPVRVLSITATAAARARYVTSPPPDENPWMFGEVPSSEAAITSTLVRCEPFIRRFIEFNSGRLDSRVFCSIKMHMIRLTEEGHKWECPPELMTFPQVFVNENGFHLGKIGDVELPDWASNGRVYSNVFRISLDSVPVSAQLCKWIDHIFGATQREYQGYQMYPDWAFEESSSPIDPADQFAYLQRGTMPSKLFSEPHPPRNPYIFTKTSVAEFTMNAPILGFKKEIALCCEGFICDFHADSMAVRRLDTTAYDRLIGVSRALDLMVLASDRRRGHAVYRLSATFVRRVEASESCACIIGGEYMIIGSRDCSISVISLESWKAISRSTFHANPVVAVGGCADLGLIASIDSQGNVIFETLFEHVMINVSKIEGKLANPIVCVFKSGIVAINRGAQVFLFDYRGSLLTVLDVRKSVVSMEKYYDVGSRELLLVSYDTEFVNLYDLTTFSCLETFTTPFLHPIVCPLKGKRAFLVSGHGRKVGVVDFSGKVTTVFGTPQSQSA